MNIHITELQRQAIAHKERTERLWRSKPKIKAVETVEPVQTKIYVRHVLPEIPHWRSKETNFDAHCENWKYHRSMSLSPTAYIKRRCEQLNISYLMMIGPSRTKELSIRRHLIIWEMMREFSISFPQAGKLMGGRDHTTALHGYRKIDAMSEADRSAIGPYVANRKRNGRAGE